MTPNQDADFIQAIVADPANDQLRLGYAEWLQQRGQPLDEERAAFLRLQCELRRTSSEGEAHWALYGRLQKVALALADEPWLVWVNNDLAIPAELGPRGRQAAMIILEVLASEKFAFTSGCQLFWTPREWKERGWELNEDCVVLVVVHDGPMNSVFTADSPDQWRRHDKMDSALRKHGMFAEPNDYVRSYIVDEEKFCS